MTETGSRLPAPIETQGRKNDTPSRTDGRTDGVFWGGGEASLGTGYLSLDLSAKCAALKAVAWLTLRGGGAVPSRAQLRVRSAKAHNAALLWLASINMCEAPEAGRQPRWLVEKFDYVKRNDTPISIESARGR